VPQHVHPVYPPAHLAFYASHYQYARDVW
jgi:hypothetical protein